MSQFLERKGRPGTLFLGAIHAPSDILAVWNRIEAAGNRTGKARSQAPGAPPELRTRVKTWLLPLARRRVHARPIRAVAICGSRVWRRPRRQRDADLRPRHH